MLKSKEDYKIAARLVCILPLAKGEGSRKVVELLLLSHNHILIWAKRNIENGLKGLKDRPNTVSVLVIVQCRMAHCTKQIQLRHLP